MSTLFQTYPYAKITVESISVGFLMIVFVYLSAYAVSFSKNLKPSLPEICSTWNQNYIMEITVFLAGMWFWFVKSMAQKLNWIS